MVIMLRQQSWPLFWVLTLFLSSHTTNFIRNASGFSSPGSHNPASSLLSSSLSLSLSSSSSGEDASYTLFDRFQATSPADLLSIRKFDPRLAPVEDDKDSDEEDDGATWVAVYRSSNNLPSVLIKDDFLNAMRVATTVPTDASSPSSIIEKKSISSSIETSTSSTSSSLLSVRTPVAVAKLVRSDLYENRWVIESMRCNLKKEDTDAACDGGSEHVEALCVCLDELIMHHLQEGHYLGEGAIRCKGTLVSSQLLEDRGFGEVTKLEKDMATHLSSFKGAMKHYADRAVTTVSKNPGARDRALKILSLLGRSDEKETPPTNTNNDNDEDNDDDDDDPWRAISQFYTGS
eukprot:CAMPEP_0197825994 /NCGR_PEP_ID=MMETSP1437-20131217/3011_1 /TAXON_ID=49252 ORGANISM="Eucampia antarctica, Strain CCMP1452" /NCGR_SAMPLE_ID=MMETSP1437 /ASSEMBLY_ACC=CAM_ASM_001096 /LENGTH=346 /DNA_ID=CAMNT_0043426231 /DNA_START=17 /DNA_END=1057 /DNA_ORIENTATION=+